MITEAPTPHDPRTRADAGSSLRVTHLWLFDAELDLTSTPPSDEPRAVLLAAVAAGCPPVAPAERSRPAGLGDAVERALAALAVDLGAAADPVARGAARWATFPAGAPPHRETSIDHGRHGVTVTVRGAVEAVLPCCTQFLDEQGRGVPLTREAQLLLQRAASRYVTEGRRVLAVAHRDVGRGRRPPASRPEAETELVLIGLIVMADPLDALVAGPQPAASNRPRRHPRRHE